MTDAAPAPDGAKDLDPGRAAPAPARSSAAAIAVACAAWALLTFGHLTGLKWAGKLFLWAKEPGNLTAAGGPSGQAAIERLLAGAALAVAAVALARLGLLLRGVDRRRLAAAALPWLAWAVMVLLIRKVYIVYATEFMHFVQYACIGFLVNRAVGGGRRPQVAFLITVLSGVADEVWQHYGLKPDDPIHFMDWSDLVLDALGAAGGILPATTLLRLRGGDDPGPDDRRVVAGALVAAAAVTLPLLLLDPVTQSRVLGHYIREPFWGEYDNDKPTHWPGPREGVPLALAGTLVLAALVDPRARGLSTGGLGALIGLAFIAVDPPSRRAGTPVHEVVPAVRAARVAAGAVTIDGRLDEQAWAGAGVAGPFLVNGAREDVPAARGATRARLLWDPDPTTGGLYVGFEVEDRDVWARDTYRDDPTLPGDEVVEVFLDDGGDEVTYYEVEVSPKNVVYDLFCLIPSGPVEYDPDTDFLCFPRWSALPTGPHPGLASAVVVDGTLDVVPNGGVPMVQDADRGWTCELFLPWSALRSPVHPSRPLAHRPIPPEPGQRWRLGLYRVERPRPAPAPADDPPVDEAGAARALGLDLAVPADAERFPALTKDLPRTPAGAFEPGPLRALAARAAAEYQAWSPTRHGSFHRPQRFGVLEFGE